VNRRTFKRAVRVGGGAVVAALACATVAAGALDTAVSGAPAAVPVVLVASVLVLVLASVSTRMRFDEPSARAQRVSKLLRLAPSLIDMQVGLALVAGCYAVLAVSGSHESPAYPLLYGVVAFSITFQSPAAAWATVFGALALEGAMFARGPHTYSALAATALHTGFIGAAAAVHAVFLRGLVSRQRRAHRERLDGEVRALRDEARDYRLIAAALGADSRAPRSREEEERKLAEGAVSTLRASIYYTISLIKRALDARTCALLWLDERGEALKIKELVSDSDAVTERRTVQLAGAVRAIVRDRSPLALPQVKVQQLPYYELEEKVGAFVGVPVFDGAHMRGVLCADRAAPFDEHSTALLQGATEQIVRAIQSEQVFTAVERSKYELERFFHASDNLCRALTLDQVMETAFDAAAQIVDVDVAAIALYQRERRRHRVHKVRIKPGSEGIIAGDSIVGLEFRENAGLASMVVKNKHYLPATGARRDPTTPIYTKRVKLKTAESLLVLPLLCADEAIGTFTLASRQPNRFGNDERDMLGIIANQVGVSLQNALMYKKMETMATTDGLTGLTNHRTFQERAADLVERSARHGHKAALLLTDVDHFKNVNDTYGHPVGDEVLRRVAKLLAGAVRKIDIVARYGGEEFVVLLEATDEDGALGLAERIRQDVEQQSFESDQGPFQVTMSFGVAVFPNDAGSREDLIERADHALYHAKESGRNRVVCYREFLEARNARRAG
jgi:diguanylate cyclase (GGDEF)-like protein